jgi:cell division protein FtsB
MQTFLTLILGLSSIVSIYYSVVGKKAYQVQLRANAELEQLLKEVQELKHDLATEHQRIRLIAHKMTTEAAPEPVAQEEPTATDGRRKSWLN